MNKDKKSTEENLLSQEEIDELLTINGFIRDELGGKSLIDEIKDAILNSGRLQLQEWKSLRTRLKEIERLIPHIDLIIELKQKEEYRNG